MKKIVRMVFGSHMYGLNTPDSDMDFKGIYLPDLNELLLGTYAKHINCSTGAKDAKNTADDIDDDWYALPEFIKLATQGETVAIDLLHANNKLSNTVLGPYGEIWEDLVSKREMFYTKNLKAYMGYVKRQAAKYGLKGSRIAAMREAVTAIEKHNGSELLLQDIWLDLPENEFAKRIELPNKTGGVNSFYEVNSKKYQSSVTVEYACERITKALDAYGSRALLAEKNEGVDWKAVQHAIRAGYQMLEIYQNGTFSYPLLQTEFLLDVKLGKLDYKTVVAPELEHIVDEIEKMHSTIMLPERADTKYWDKWLLDVYKEHLLPIPAFGLAHD